MHTVRKQRLDIISKLSCEGEEWSLQHMIFARSKFLSQLKKNDHLYYHDIKNSLN